MTDVSSSIRSCGMVLLSSLGLSGNKTVVFSSFLSPFTIPDLFSRNVPERSIISLYFSSIAFSFPLIARVTTEAGNIPGNFSDNFSVFSWFLGFSITLGSIMTLSPAKSFPSINDIPSIGNDGLVPTIMLPFIKLDLIFTSWRGTSKMPISTPEISTFAPVKLVSVRGKILSNISD